ncbi:MAG: DUF4136 domain-containing protein [Gemmatimonadaceae bacterium]
MRSTLLLGGLAALALASTSCSSGGGFRVTTTAAPGANLAELRTFRVLNAPPRHPGTPAPPTADPLLTNSIMNQRMHADLVEGFEKRGYLQNVTNPDFLVAYYVIEAREDTRGSVIIDVIHAATTELLWRGQGVVNMWTGSITYGLELDDSVAAIVRKFPRRF